ncbi:MAG: hypothetical protein LBD18_03875 [Treponema sp.]|jgi:hypothetical protein|nr:hypothetical protein [Treponema sp.]
MKIDFRGRPANTALTCHLLPLVRRLPMEKTAGGGMPALHALISFEDFKVILGLDDR